MKQKILLLLVMSFFITVSHAQKKEQKPKGYAITGQQKGHNGWKEVRLVDVTSGEELQTIYKGSQEIETLNARTGKAVAKKDASSKTTFSSLAPTKKVVNLDQELDKIRGDKVHMTRVMYVTQKVQTDKPFSTNSAAMAYDKKHDRLYYTPMNINQLRYIDLKSKTPKIFYFEDEAFGTAGPGVDVGKQITRMVIASDGDGYALTNDANHLIRFTTGKNPVITDLGALTDDAINGKYSVHSRGGYGGDIIADASKNIYLITANRNVFKINIESKLAKYLGTIKGLPQGFSTNGAMVEEGSKVIVCSSESTVGYFRFDLTTMLAEKISTGSSVFNASDLANGNLAFDKKKKEKKEKKDIVKEAPEQLVTVEKTTAKQDNPAETLSTNRIAVYPNPVSDGLVKLSFTDLPAGRYQVQLLDMAGKLISSEERIISNKMQIEELRLPGVLGKGTYLVKVFNEENKISSTTKLVVQ